MMKMISEKEKIWALESSTFWGVAFFCIPPCVFLESVTSFKTDALRPVGPYWYFCAPFLDHAGKTLSVSHAMHILYACSSQSAFSCLLDGTVHC